MGNSIQQPSAGISLITTPELWLEGEAIKQLHTTATLPDISYAAAMPDIHLGRGYPVGAAFFTTQLIYPALIGGDIGCGMSLWQTSLKTHAMNQAKLIEQLGNLDQPLNASECISLWPDIQPLQQHNYASGTIGGGNHFAELQMLDTIYVAEIAEQIGLNKQHLQLMVHSGSRGLGGAILDKHIRQYGHQGLIADSEAGKSYLTQHNQALAYARQNRELIARRILTNLRAQGQKLADISHNFIEAACIHGESGWLHRKGAAPATQGLVVIPGSRGDYSYLVQPLDTPIALYSLAHGAGRKWQRSACKGRLSRRYTVEQLSRTVHGSRVICADRELIYEEAPQAYKSIDSVITAMVQAKLIRPIARFKPVVTYKVKTEKK
ncbi:RNA ligase RtcB family protein [Snodgrassella alvi]|uniref:RNA ligase RtcB family protein n=1 Tax=Snodgrassella alvi TaxID=1196083 RepID=UPI00345FF466